MLTKSRPQRRRWIVLTAAAFSLTIAVACSSPQTQETSDPQESSQADNAGGSGQGAEDTPSDLPSKRADGAQLVELDRCAVYQQSNGNTMRWYTPGDSPQCEAWISSKRDKGTTRVGYHDMLASKKAYYSDWYTFTSTEEPSVCVNNNSGQMECGPE